jgi:hypothetical protein
MSRGFNQLKLAGYFPLVMDKIRVFLGEWGRWEGAVDWLATAAAAVIIHSGTCPLRV